MIENFEELNTAMHFIGEQLERIADQLEDQNNKLDNVTCVWKDGQEHIAIGGVIDTFEQN